MVTNLKYLDFVQKAGYGKPRHWNPSEPYFAEDLGNAPVTWVSWEDAVAYCDWSNGQLPNDNEAIYTKDVLNIGEWYNAGTDQEKKVCYQSNSSELVNRKTPRRNISFRCFPIQQKNHVRQWVVIDGGNYTLGCDPMSFNKLADKCGLSIVERQPIINRLACVYKIANFKISTTCVTNEEYYAFTQETGARWPCHWGQYLKRPFPARLKFLPVVNITAQDAKAYCVWSRTRLPTWFEWECAASGQSKRLYPWSSNYNASFCNSKESGYGSLITVNDCILGDTPDGVRQMCGNVAEWVIGLGGQFEIRGGSYLLPCELWGVSYIFRQKDNSFFAPDIGFRVIQC